MTLAIPNNRIYRVMIGGKWHNCVPDSFRIDSYEYCESSQEDWSCFAKDSGITYVGFAFEKYEAGSSSTVVMMAGPMTAIQAVEYADWAETRRREKEKNQ